MRHVLVVEDDDAIRQLLVYALEGADFEVRAVADGVEGLTEMEQDPPACAVIDVMMPRLDGFGLLRAMRQRHVAPSTRIIMLTCRTEERDFVRGWELGVDAYLTKPFDPDQLAFTVHEVCSLSQDHLQQRRKAELNKAQLLDRLESAIRRPEAMRPGPTTV